MRYGARRAPPLKRAVASTAGADAGLSLARAREELLADTPNRSEELRSSDPNGLTRAGDFGPYDPKSLTRTGVFGSYDPNAGQGGASGAGARPAEGRSPTIEQSHAFQNQFDYLNVAVIEPALGVRLPSMMLSFSRRASDGGAFTANRWSEDISERLHEVALHPAAVKAGPPIETSATILHQMVHAWQHTHGTPGRRGYHNTEWAKAMVKAGLIPSATGTLGGARTGQRVLQYVAPGGLFETAFHGMPGDFYLPWSSFGAETGARGEKKATYDCPRCGITVWGRAALDLNCNICDARMVVRG
jgi:hypothetical protein